MNPKVDVFFYGTLRHVPLLKVILGRAGVSGAACPAQLNDHAVYQVGDEPFPMIEPTPGAVAPGLLVRGLTGKDIARLEYYEGGFEYDLTGRDIVLNDGQQLTAQVFFPKPGHWPKGPVWSFQQWQADWAALTLRTAAEVMHWYGHFNARQVAERITIMRIRAGAWLAAQSRPADPDRDVDRDVIVQAHHRPYANFFAVEEMDLQFRRHDGKMNPVVNRGALIVGQAAVVLPYDPRRDQVLLIEQFRAPLFMSGDRAPWVWEPVAGLVDPGETPEQTAHREAKEEAGLTLSALEPAGQVYSSTGSSSEFLHLFVGLADLSGSFGLAGLAEEGEDIRSQIIGFETLMQGIDTHQYKDMPLVTMALWLARHRDRLRMTY